MRRRSLLFRKTKERWMRAISWLVLAVSLGGMAWILWTTVSKGISVLSLTFLLESSKPYGIESSGIGNALQGTLYITLGAALMTLPAAMAGGVWLAEYGKNSKIGQGVRFCANVMMGIPSIITGLFVYAVWVVPTGHFSGFAGSLALSIIMFPIIMRTTEDMIRMVPDSLREASLALGMKRWKATVRIVCRSAKSGLITGILLALARASGETAPLLFTALWSNSWSDHYFSQPTANIPVLITEYTTNSPFDELHAAGWGAALVMMTIILLINVSVRYFFGGKDLVK